MSYTVDWGDEFDGEIERLPEEHRDDVRVALARLFPLLEEMPHQKAGTDHARERTIAFGGQVEEHGDGLLGYWVDDEKQLVYPLRLRWWPSR